VISFLLGITEAFLLILNRNLILRWRSDYFGVVTIFDKVGKIRMPYEIIPTVNENLES
jgi:hypothetical protein